MRFADVSTPRARGRLRALAVGLLALLLIQCRPETPTPIPTIPPTPPPPTAAAPEPTPAPPRPDYLRVAREYADAMIAHGRDVEGPARSPLFATTLDRRSLRLLTSVPPLEGMRPEDRAINAANPMHDENLYQILYALTEITGDRRYADAADAALGWFLTHTQSPSTGLLAWGEHLGWDLQSERRIVVTDSANKREAEHLESLYEYGTHEYYRPWVLWGRTFELAPEATARFAWAVWNGHVGNRRTGEFDRHAGYERREVSTGKEFPRHGGFYIATWAAAYERTRDRDLLRAIATLLDYFEAHRNKESGMVVAMSSRPDLGWPSQNLSLAIDLSDAARILEQAKVPTTYHDLPGRMRVSAARNDLIFLKIARDTPYAEHGFARAVDTDTLKPGDDRRADGDPLFTAPWDSTYGDETDAQVGMLCLLRYHQTGDPSYRALVLTVADRYITSDPDPSSVVYPGPVGIAINLELSAHRLTGQRKYLDRAHHFAELALERFFDGSPLPAASSRSDHYEALTRGDTLVMELLDLWFEVNRPGREPPLIYSDR
jgi:hypothetical protein